MQKVGLSQLLNTLLHRIHPRTTALEEYFAKSGNVWRPVVDYATTLTGNSRRGDPAPSQMQSYDTPVFCKTKSMCLKRERHEDLLSPQNQRSDVWCAP